MRIAVVMPAGCKMDSERFNSMEAVATSLNRHSRFRSDIVVICDAGAERPAPLNLLTVPKNLSKPARRRAVAGHLRRFGPDIIEYHQNLAQSASVARSFPGAVNVLYRHTRIKPPGNLFERFRYRSRLRAFDHLLFVSQAATMEFSSDYPDIRVPRSWVSNPVDTKAWAPPPVPPEMLILFVGRALPEKGMDAFCLALEHVLDTHPHWRGALVLGEYERHEAWAGPHLERLERFGHRVEVHRSAPLAKVIAITQRAAIAVTPSRIPEGLGLTALEAHAAGAALVSSGRGGLREASGPHALYVDPPEAAGLADAINRLIIDAPLRQSLADAGRLHACSTHGLDARAKELDALRLNLIAPGPPDSRQVR